MNTRAALLRQLIDIFQSETLLAETNVRRADVANRFEKQIQALITEANAALIERVRTEVIGRDATGDHEIAEGVRQFQAEQRQKLHTLKQQVGGKS